MSHLSLNPLTGLRRDIEEHWRLHCPARTAELIANGEWAAALDRAAAFTEQAVLAAVADGTDFWAAWEIYREKWAFLPAETQDEEIILPPEDDDWNEEETDEQEEEETDDEQEETT